ncbi:ribosomal protein S5 domain 2-like protein [Fomitiporia mediterranea MF3/22]|uniref:ribosomal protein S5 domain 2-like protein n=1 Tax=Fomitiporia mediterranea (strain MF3/22) TaxID=694068 RepID=UPI0004408B03|nr:ribosomal protein S5 domain 2-like protein [Fomitiporia mediterranea MF3/22]EJD00493.1 ribosomal protein S5 domain 2-like protein [Fomitiporia mediterranea MF3/22]
MASSKSEQAYIQSSLLADPPFRTDGRALDDYRPIALETQVAPLANGSTRVSIGGSSLVAVGGGLPGTEVLAVVKLEVEDIVNGDGVDGGRMVCNVSCSSAAYPSHNHNAIDELQNELTNILHETLSDPTLRPKNLSILHGKKSWLLHLDLLILSDTGNILDALFLAAAAALRDTRVPRTRSVEYRARKEGKLAVDRLVSEDATMADEGQTSGLDTRALQKATDFELEDYWDEGELLQCETPWPLCITLNLVPPIHYLDATSIEEGATSLRLILFFSLHESGSILQGMRLLGPGEVNASLLKALLRHGERYARELQKALDAHLISKTTKHPSI